MNYRAQKDKQERVERMIANIPAGTEFEIYTIGYNGKRIEDTGVVVGHTKSGNVKLETTYGRKFKTSYHFQKLDKSSSFDVAGRYRHYVKFA